MSRNISYALTGWLAGVATIVVMSVVWPLIFPAIVNIDHYYGAGPSLPVIVIIGLLVIFNVLPVRYKSWISLVVSASISSIPSIIHALARS